MVFDYYFEIIDELFVCPHKRCHQFIDVSIRLIRNIRCFNIADECFSQFGHYVSLAHQWRYAFSNPDAGAHHQ